MPAMSELFYREPYCKEFKATVISCSPNKDKYDLVLSDTAFYPEGGGQPSDTGLINEAFVSFVKKVGGNIVHSVDKPFEAGQEITGKIDWNKRFDNMQNHSCEHIFSGIANALHGTANVGFHMADDLITVDFDKYLTAEEIAKIEAATNEAILKDAPVKIFFPDEKELQELNYRSKKELKGTVRIVEFPGSDRCACCGTHVSRTGEIGMCKVISSMKHRGGTRVQFVAGERLHNYFNMLLRESASCVEQLSAKPQEISKALGKLFEENESLREKLNRRTEKLFENISVNLPEKDKLLLVNCPSLTPFEIKIFATKLSEQKSSRTIAVISEQNNSGLFYYIIYSVLPDLPQLTKKFNAALNGKGGGKAPFVQGSVNSTEEKIEQTLKELFG